MEARFKKMDNGEWRVAVSERIDVDGGHGTITVSMRDGSQKKVTLTRNYSRENGLYLYIPVSDKRPIAFPARRVSVGRSERGVCSACEWNMDAGDMRGCPKHRGHPRT